MKSKNPPGATGPRRHRPMTDPPASGGRRRHPGFHPEPDRGVQRPARGGVSVRKDARGYTLMREDDGIPVARLRPKGQGLFEVLYWNPYHERWRAVGSFGTVLALDQALEFIADDPLDCFWR